MAIWPYDLTKVGMWGQPDLACLEEVKTDLLSASEEMSACIVGLCDIRLQQLNLV